jgi:TonB family protein
VFFEGLRRGLAVGLLLIGAAEPTLAPNAWGQGESKAGESGRKTKNKVAPAYPELARSMKISGVVKVQLTVAPNGTVKDAKVVGGHPVLANAVLDAVKKWRYESRPQETTENLEFRFGPNQ